MDIVAGNLGRRNFLRTGLGGAALSLSSCSPIEPARRGEGGTPAASGFAAFSRVVDLTHTYSNRFTHWAGGTARVELETVSSTAKGDGWNVTRWTLDEHAGTHIDSPFHRNPNGLTVDRIPPRDLVLPLAIIDIRKKAEENEDAQVTIEDLRAWEKTHGPLPERCCVAMLSGWDARVEKPGFINFDDEGVRHFPGFHTDAAIFMLEERRVLLLTLTDTDGVTTWSECSVDDRPTDSPETIDTAWLAITNWIGPRILGTSLGHPAEVDSLLNRGIRGHRAAKAAIEMGTWALWSIREGHSLAHMLGGNNETVLGGIVLAVQPTPDILVDQARHALSLLSLIHI